MSDFYDGDTTPDPPSGTDDSGQSSQPQDGATSVDDQSSGQPPANVPSFRLRQETERRQQFERAYYSTAQQLQQLQQEVERLRGGRTPASTTPAPAGAPVDENGRIREQFAKVFPELASLAQRAKDLEAMLEQAPNISAQTEHYWTQLGAEYLQSLDEQANAIYGDKLSPNAKRFFQQAFIDWVENDPQAQQRYLSHDKKLVTDFWQILRSHVLDPVRRSAAVNLETRGQRVARLPQPGPQTPPPTRGPAKPKTEDELHDAAFAALFSQGD